MNNKKGVFQKVTFDTVWINCEHCQQLTPHVKETERSDPDDPVTYYKCEYCNFITL